MKLNTKILLLILPLVVTPIATIGWFAYQQISENSFNNSTRQAQTILQDIASRIRSFESNTNSNLELFSNDNLIHKYVLTSEESRYDLLMPALLRLFSTYQKAYPDYYEIRIIMPDGFEDARRLNRDIDNVTEEEANSSVGSRILINNNKTVSFFQKNPDNQELSYYASKALIIKDRAFDSQTAKPKLRAYLSITASINWLKEIINQQSIGEEGFLFLADSNGRVYVSNNNQSLITASAKITQIFKKNNENINIKKLVNNHEYNNHNLLTLGETQGYLWSKPVSKQFMLYAWYPNKEILHQSRQLGISITSIALFSILLLSVLVFKGLDYFIVRPIKRLEQSTKDIGRGDLINDIVINSNDEIGSLAESFNSMSQNLLRSTEQIKYLAYHDDLTGLPNRLMFHEYATQAVAFAKRNRQRLSILYLDLDNFKRVNDTMGHKAGDFLLKKVSDRVLSCLRESDYASRPDEEITDIAARIGGDEFLVLLHDIPDNFLPGKVANRIIDVLSEPVIIDNNQFYVSASIGITIFPDDAITTDNLIKHADIAMYHAKNSGKNNYQYFLESMNSSLIKRMALENKLRTAITDNQLFLNYQPQIDLLTGEIYGVEALVRWNDPEAGLVSPNTFISIAEETGLIVELGEWVLKQACQQVRNWQLEGIKPIKVSVNFSAVQFAKVDLPELIISALKETGLEAQYLDIEITETVIMEDIEKISSVLNQIRKLGCAISLDDFGTGYSSLNYLRQFPIDTLKIDRSFVKEIDDNADDKSAIIIAIIAMSHALNLKVVAEGIETKTQLDQLIEWQCDYIQGFYLHRPLAAPEIEELLLRD